MAENTPEKALEAGAGEANEEKIPVGYPDQQFTQATQLNRALGAGYALARLELLLSTAEHARAVAERDVKRLGSAITAERKAHKAALKEARTAQEAAEAKAALLVAKVSALEDDLAAAKGSA